MKTKLSGLILTGLLLSTIGCQSHKKPMTGNDSDDHGCKGSAGYTWSQSKQRCVRPFEEGFRMMSNKDSTLCGYLVLSDDSMFAELFAPEGPEIFSKERLPDGTLLWKSEKPDSKYITEKHGYWQVYQRDILLYEQEAKSRSIIAIFAGSDGKTRRYYQVEAAFYPTLEIAKIRFDDEEYQLQQYRTADGYGYKNDSIDLRGKGDEATLTIGKNLVLQLTERK